VSRGVHARTIVAMGTLVTVRVVGADEPSLVDKDMREARDRAVERALAWFHDIEASCSRFDPKSELMQLSRRIGDAVPVGAALFEALQFALAVAEETGGAFDPTVGAAMEARGFNREHRTLEVVHSGVADAGCVSYRDVRLDPGRNTVTLLRPLVLDLGAVAKGLAVDMAARELDAFPDYAVNAGGDLYLAGSNEAGEPWRVGIRHPREDNAIIDAVRVSDMAVCTSGDYERRAPDASAHILNPRTREPAGEVVSATVVARTAMLADAAATAAFVLGPAAGLELFDRLGVNGLVITSTLERFATRGMPSELAAPVLSNAQRSSDDRARDPGRDSGAGRGR
jgi:thiamine biosynthesis lipoprotein